MTIGLVLLGIIAVLLFFGAAEKYFDRLGLTSWLAFLLVLALIIGAVMPEVRAGTFVMTVGGFAVPLVAFIVLLGLNVRHGTVMRGVLSLVIVAMAVVAFRLLIGTETETQVLVGSLLTGFVGGALAYLAAGTRLGTLAGALGGCVIGDAVSAGLATMFFGAESYVLGGYGIFDSMIIAAVFGLVVAETVSAVRRKANDKRAAAAELNAETAEDFGADPHGDKPPSDASGEDEEEKARREEDDRL